MVTYSWKHYVCKNKNNGSGLAQTKSGAQLFFKNKAKTNYIRYYTYWIQIYDVKNRAFTYELI